MGSITISRSEDHTPDISQVTLCDFDLLNPTSRWMSAHKLCGFRADLKQGQAACICTTKPLQTAFEIPLDANEFWPSPHRPPLPGRMRASPALASIDLHAWVTHQQGRYLNLLFYSKAWTRQTAVRGNFYWTSPLLSSAVGYIHKVLHALVKSASSHNVFFYGMEKVGSSRQSHSFFLHQKFDKRHLKTEIVPAGPSLLSLVWIYPAPLTLSHVSAVHQPSASIRAWSTVSRPLHLEPHPRKLAGVSQPSASSEHPSSSTGISNLLSMRIKKHIIMRRGTQPVPALD
ncbi:hypothetical protein BGZ57DRAFT_855861 [Hyaloscypha finlandica]|nr:hypothetical protein BGZ57DRAFT_855861 [Hyaloscypha finlandica]